MHSLTETSGKLQLDVGYFPIEIQYFQRGVGAELIFSHSNDVPTLPCGAPACARFYTGLGSGNLAALTSSEKFPDHPDEIKAITAGTFQTLPYGTNYGVLLEGFIMAPSTGKYTFMTHSDDSSQVWVGTQPGSTTQLVKVVELTGCCYEAQGSTEVEWVRGSVYYIKGLMKQGSAGNYLKIGMLLAGKRYMPIPMHMFITGQASSSHCSCHIVLLVGIDKVALPTSSFVLQPPAGMH